MIENADGKISLLDKVLNSMTSDQLQNPYSSVARRERIKSTECMRFFAKELVYRQVTQDESGNSQILDKIISDYKAGNIDAITAKKVLDEGANIPEIKTAFFIASTKTEREWIQRRGRVLRMAKGKSEAVIHDFLCIPNSDFDLKDIRSVFDRELTRAEEFAGHSSNKLEKESGC